MHVSRPYQNRFSVGERVSIAALRRLEEFKNSWELHHPVAEEQLKYAGQDSVVIDVSFYHGGDVLYELDKIPGIWHECCLKSAVEKIDSPQTP